MNAKNNFSKMFEIFKNFQSKEKEKFLNNTIIFSVVYKN